MVSYNRAMDKARNLFRRQALLPGLAAAALLSLGAPLWAQPAGANYAAPTRLYPDPNVYGMITLPGDLVTVRYGVGYLDRAARAQLLIEPIVRIMNRWTGTDLTVNIYVLTREEWQQSRMNVPYGVPVRVGRNSLLLPAGGDDEVVRLWAALKVPLPTNQNPGAAATPGQASASLFADYLALNLLGEIYADRLDLRAGEPWVQGFLGHAFMAPFFERQAPDARRDLEPVWRAVIAQRGAKSMAAADYRPEMALPDWLYFQAHFFFGARALVGEEGRGIVKNLRRIKKKGDGVILGAALLDKYEDLKIWYYDSFTTISTLPVR
jgi:hypothetical protein